MSNSNIDTIYHIHSLLTLALQLHCPSVGWHLMSPLKVPATLQLQGSQPTGFAACRLKKPSAQASHARDVTRSLQLH